MARDFKDIDDPCVGYARNLTKWTLPRDLSEGAQAMREGQDPINGAWWLPQFSAEEPEDFHERRRTATLHGLFSSGVDRLASQPFGKSVQISEMDRLDKRLIESADGSDGYLDDIDGDGTSLTDFARRCYEDATTYGITHALTRHTAQDESDTGGRPIIEHVPALSLIGWIYDDAGTLIDCRISGTIVERDPENPWQEVEYQTTRRYYLTDAGVMSEFYVHDDENKKQKQRGKAQEMRGDPVLLTDEAGSPLAEIPLFTLYFRRTGQMEADPPLMALAEANLAHYRALSDYDSAVHGAAVPMLAMTGIEESSQDPGEATMQTEEKVSVHRVVKTKAEGAKFYWVEISGAACEAARTRVKDIEERAETLGGQPKTRAGAGTATAVWVDERSSEGKVSSWNRAVEAFLTLCLWSMGDWMGSPMPRECIVNIPEDRPLTQGRLEEVHAILAIYNAGDLLPKKDALTALASVVPSLEKIDVDEAIEIAQSEPRRAGTGDLGEEFGAGVPLDEEEEDDVGE